MKCPKCSSEMIEQPTPDDKISYGVCSRSGYTYIIERTESGIIVSTLLELTRLRHTDDGQFLDEF